MDENFLRVLFPARHRVLGRWLPALSYWHLATLHALRSPFVTGEGEIALSDIQLAVKIAHTRWPQQPELQPTLREWWQRLRHDRDVAFVNREATAFATWRAAHELRPRFWESEDCIPRMLTAPAVLARVAQLERLTKFTHDQAWNDVTPGYAAWFVSTIQEQEGAELRFEQEGDDDDDGLADLTTLDEAALFDVVKADVGEADALAWLERRRETVGRVCDPAGKEAA